MSRAELWDETTSLFVIYIWGHVNLYIMIEMLLANTAILAGFPPL